MPIYMKFGDTIKGNVSEAGHKEWIELGSCQFGAGRAIAMNVGAALKDREASAPNLSEIVVTKEWDSGSSSSLFQEALQSDMDTKVQIDFVRTVKAKLDIYLTIKLDNVAISGYSLSSGGDKPSESISLSYTKIEYSPFKVADDASPAAGSKVTYDLAQAKTV
ncbi:Hcp family type VI secretion system effector [Falsiroseomonas sp. HW251]|uniref:Hcp family type VI secretion system effector n=1 Tax=Falsiroseomonas sp. HW251 TaxID=3390998 RepID=UPI003D31D936